MSKRFNLGARINRHVGHPNMHNNITSESENNTDNNSNENTNNNNSRNNNIIQNAYSIGNLKNVKIKIPKVIKIRLIIAAIVIFIFFFLLIYVSIIINGKDIGDFGSLASGGYYDIGCEEVTVNLTNKNSDGTYENIGTGTYPLEEYVAGVVTAEVGQFNNPEVFKEFAIAARSYFAAHHSSCTIESSDKYQVFSPSPTTLAVQAADETKGKVLLSGDKLYGSIQYDAFACIGEEGDYYIISQGNQRIHKNWIENRISKTNKPNWFICNGKENLNEHHGNGLSQWGSLYLAQEENRTYDEILRYYLGDDVTISGSSMMSIANLEIKNTTDAKALHEPLSTFLPSHGSSVDDLNNFIKNSVQQNGYRTRAGVVTAAVSLVNYLYDGAKVRLPYYWGGDYQKIGVNPEFGGKAYRPAVSIHGNTYHYNGFDCSGFVSWAIKNGGFDISRKSTSGFHTAYSSNSCVITDGSCEGQPGDLINSNGCHVQMIVSVDKNSGRYYVAESTGSKGLIMRPVGMHEGNCGGKETRILHMNSLYGD